MIWTGPSAYGRINQAIDDYFGGPMMLQKKQKSPYRLILLIGLITGLILTGCSTVNPEPTPEADPQPLTGFNPVVSATGEVVPLHCPSCPPQPERLKPPRKYSRN